MYPGRTNTPSPTTAQRIGLDPRPDNPAKMSEYEWAAAKTRSNLRQDSRAPCVICKQNFGRDPQVVLRTLSLSRYISVISDLVRIGDVVRNDNTY